MLEIENTNRNEDGLISRLDMSEDIQYHQAIENMSIETSKTKNIKRKKTGGRVRVEQNIQEHWNKCRLSAKKKKKLLLIILYSNCRKSKKKKILKEAREKNILPIEKQR